MESSTWPWSGGHKVGIKEQGQSNFAFYFTPTSDLAEIKGGPRGRTVSAGASLRLDHEFTTTSPALLAEKISRQLFYLGQGARPEFAITLGDATGAIIWPPLCNVLA